MPIIVGSAIDIGPQVIGSIPFSRGAMKKFAIVLLALPLAACFDKQETQLAKCDLETQLAGIDPGSETGIERMRLCMHAGGYQRDTDHEICRADEALQPSIEVFCYSPAEPIPKWLHQVEMYFRFRNDMKLILGPETPPPMTRGTDIGGDHLWEHFHQPPNPQETKSTIPPETKSTSPRYPNCILENLKGHSDTETNIIFNVTKMCLTAEESVLPDDALKDLKATGGLAPNGGTGDWIITLTNNSKYILTEVSISLIVAGKKYDYVSDGFSPSTMARDISVALDRM
jgi:hypothetical protein